MKKVRFTAVAEREPRLAESCNYGLGDLGSIPGSANFFSSAQRQVLLWGTTVSYQVVKRGGGIWQGHEDDHSHLMLMSRMLELWYHFPLRLPGVVLNYRVG
jgi:hypothetical protein